MEAGGVAFQVRHLLVGMNFEVLRELVDPPAL
ncbi:hypothetical protein QE408_001540 [Agrobacterium larrymoorei]|uniref:Uncharacterized protein n=1 Tax=Agrobacterium larrymoorei TaxID=160699 RepID=A0ABU0UHR2_9HYPH|nr:hypothetical protein [Agrobacterium larrymoorei]